MAVHWTLGYHSPFLFWNDADCHLIFSVSVVAYLSPSLVIALPPKRQKRKPQKKKVKIYAVCI